MRSYNAEIHSAPRLESSSDERKSRPKLLIKFAAGLIVLALLFMFILALVRKSSPMRHTTDKLLGRDPPVLLISMDGFRHDYLEIVRAKLGQESLPNFKRMEREGVRANYSMNVFPTVTFPNHQTLITGLYSESHGVVSNDVIDSGDPNYVMSMNDQRSLNNDPWISAWPKPLWVTLQRLGRWSGSLLWPVSDGTIQSDRPFQQVSQWKILDYGNSVFDFEERVKTLLFWLTSGNFQLDYIMAYFPQPDHDGHAFGPYSDRVAQRIKMLDDILGQLLTGIDQSGLSVNILLTADHGMAAIPKENNVNLDNYVDSSWYNVSALDTYGFLYPVPGKLDAVYKLLVNAHPHMKVYHLRDVPVELHFNTSNSRTPPLVLIPDPYWYIGQPRSSDLYTHGYRPDMPDMHAFFIARGPAFRSNERVGVVHAIDVYALSCALLKIAPGHPHNGSLDRIGRLLLKPEVFDSLVMRSWLLADLHSWLSDHLEVIFIVCVSVALMGSLMLLWVSRRLSGYARNVVVPHEESGGQIKSNRLVDETSSDAFASNKGAEITNRGNTGDNTIYQIA